MPCSRGLAMMVPLLALAMGLAPTPPSTAQTTDETAHVLVSGDLVTAGSILGGNVPFSPDGSITVADSGRWIRTRLGDYDAFRFSFTIHGDRTRSQVFLGLGDDGWRADVPPLAIPLLDRRVPLTRAPREDFARDTLYLETFATLSRTSPPPPSDAQTFEFRRWPHGGTQLLVNGTVILDLAMSCCGRQTWLGFKVLGEPIELRELSTTRLPTLDQRAAPLPGEPMYSLPRPTRHATPRYPANALRDGVTGKVRLLCLVDAAGKVRAATVVRSFDTGYGIDREAVVATRDWRFAPARIDGLAMPAVVWIEQSFSISPR